MWLSLLGSREQSLFSLPPASITISALLAALWVTTRCIISALFESFDGYCVYPQAPSRCRGNSQSATLILSDIWSLQVEEFPKRRRAARLNVTVDEVQGEFQVCSLTHESSFMVQFIWCLMRCTCTSVKHKYMFVCFFKFKGYQIRQWNSALVVLHLNHIKPPSKMCCRITVLEHKRLQFKWVWSGRRAGLEVKTYARLWTYCTLAS